jgi:hypothetical protein
MYAPRKRYVALRTYVLTEANGKNREFLKIFFVNPI